jgi:hypothetical protein
MRQLDLNAAGITALTLLGGVSVAIAVFIRDNVAHLCLSNLEFVPYTDVLLLLIGLPVFCGFSVIGVLLLKLIVRTTSYGGSKSLVNAIIVHTPVIVYGIHDIPIVSFFKQSLYLYSELGRSIIGYVLAILLMSVGCDVLKKYLKVGGRIEQDKVLDSRS